MAGIPLDRDALKKRYGDLYSVASAVLWAADPIGLAALGAPSDEYEPEVGTILARLSQATGVDEVQRIVHEEFVAWFGSDTAGPFDHYAAAAIGVWRAWKEFSAAR